MAKPNDFGPRNTRPFEDGLARTQARLGDCQAHSTNLRWSASGPARIPLPGFTSVGTASVDQGQMEGNQDGKESQIYSLAAAGRAQLEKEAENWSRLSAAINLVVETT